MGFTWGGKTYKYLVMAFGNRSSPWLLSRIMAPAIRTLRLQGLTLLIYVDDILIMSPTRAKCTKDTKKAVKLLTSLGWNINFNKSVLIPTQSIEYLGFILDTTDRVKIDIPKKKRKVISHEAARMSRASFTRPKFLALQEQPERHDDLRLNSSSDDDDSELLISPMYSDAPLTEPSLPITHKLMELQRPMLSLDR